jgi:hypothetical protein
LAHASKRSLERITKRDLARLRDIARADRERMFNTNPRWAHYRDRLLCVALCQGAAFHLLRGYGGIKDFDVWSFFARSPKRPFPDPALYRRNGTADFGRSRFGRTPSALSTITGRRVDLLSRSLDASPGANPIDAVQMWLGNGRGRSARLLRQKAVILIEPLIGTIVWPPE